jgi:hypothetical protein
MISIRGLSIPNKIVAIIMIISAASLLLASGVLITYDFIAARQDLRESTRSDAVDTLNSLRAESSIVASCIYTPAGLFAERLTPNRKPCPREPLLREELDGDLITGVPIELNTLWSFMAERSWFEVRGTTREAYSRSSCRFPQFAMNL